MNLGQIVQTHALSFFHLSAPDLLLGMDSDPAEREHLRADRRPTRSSPAAASACASSARRSSRSLGGKRIHPAWAVAGGVREAARRGRARPASGPGCPRRSTSPSSRPGAGSRSRSSSTTRRTRVFGNFPSLFLGLVAPGRRAGALRRHAARRGRRRATSWPTASSPPHYREFIGEAVEPWSYLKFPVLQAARLPRRHVPGRPAGAAQRLRRAPARRAPTTSCAEFRQLGRGGRALPRSTTTTPG